MEVQDRMIVATERRAYPTDLTDAQWALLDPWLSERAWTGRPRTVDLREVANAVFYLLRTGCQWRHLPHDFPHWCTVRYYYDLWMWNGTWVRINTALCARITRAWGAPDREGRGGEGRPSAAVIDSQSAKATESGGERGYDGGKKSGGPETLCGGGYGGPLPGDVGGAGGLVGARRRAGAARAARPPVAAVAEGVG